MTPAADVQRRVLDARWFACGDGDVIGAVALRGTGGRDWAAYLGPAWRGEETADSEAIAEHGAQLPENLARAFFPAIATNHPELEYRR